MVLCFSKSPLVYVRRLAQLHAPSRLDLCVTFFSQPFLQNSLFIPHQDGR